MFRSRRDTPPGYFTSANSGLNTASGKLANFGLNCVIRVFLPACAALFISACAPSQSLKGVSKELSQADQLDVKNVFRSQKRIAVLIGINQFDDQHWNQLKYAVKDAQEMAAVLNDTRYGSFDKVILLTGQAETSKGNIQNALSRLSELNISKEDTIVVYVSTHGTLARTRDGRLHQYLVARDTRFNAIPDTAIDVDNLRTQIGNLPSQKKVIIFASCHSGKGKSRLNDNMVAELNRLKASFFVKPIEKASEAMIVLAASAWGEAAREDSRLENDVYTHFLIEGIKRHDSNGDGAVTVSEAHDYAKEQTYYLTNGEQRPSMESVVLGVDPIILAGKVVRSGKSVLYDYSKRYEDMIILVDGEKKGTLPLGVALDPGVHLVELKTAANDIPVYSEMFRVSGGDRIALPVLLQGYDSGISFRIGYQGYVTEEIQRSVAKPMPMAGIAYTRGAYFSPRAGYRVDLSYGEAKQMLNAGHVDASASVSQVTAGIAVLFREDIGGMALYGGPRLGALQITREFDTAGASKENSISPVIGAVAGLHTRYKKNLSLAFEATSNYSSMDFRDTSTNTFDYSMYGSFSFNF